MQESIETLKLSNIFEDLKQKHEKALQEAKLSEQIRMLESVKKLFADGKIDREAVEILALEIAMGE